MSTRTSSRTRRSTAVLALSASLVVSAAAVPVASAGGDGTRVTVADSGTELSPKQIRAIQRAERRTGRAKTTPFTAGWVTLGRGFPVKRADLSIETLRGKVLCGQGDRDERGPATRCANIASGRLGAFAVARAGLPKRFVVVADGGTVRGRSLKGELHAVVHRDRHVTTTSLTPASSIEVALIRGGMKPGRAHRVVKHYFRLSGPVPDLGHATHFNGQVLSGRKVLRSLSKHARWDKWVKRRAAEARRGDRRAHLGGRSGGVAAQVTAAADGSTGSTLAALSKEGAIGFFTNANYDPGKVSAFKNFSMNSKLFNGGMLGYALYSLYSQESFQQGAEQQLQNISDQIAAINEKVNVLDQAFDSEIRAIQATQARTLFQAADVNLQSYRSDAADVTLLQQALADNIAEAVSSEDTTGVDALVASTMQAIRGKALNNSLAFLPQVNDAGDGGRGALDLAWNMVRADSRARTMSTALASADSAAFLRLAMGYLVVQQQFLMGVGIVASYTVSQALAGQPLSVIESAAQRYADKVLTQSDWAGACPGGEPVPCAQSAAALYNGVGDRIPVGLPPGIVLVRTGQGAEGAAYTTLSTKDSRGPATLTWRSGSNSAATINDVLETLNGDPTGADLDASAPPATFRDLSFVGPGAPRQGEVVPQGQLQLVPFADNWRMPNVTQLDPNGAAPVATTDLAELLASRQDGTGSTLAGVTQAFPDLFPVDVSGQLSSGGTRVDGGNGPLVPMVFGPTGTEYVDSDGGWMGVGGLYDHVTPGQAVLLATPGTTSGEAFSARAVGKWGLFDQGGAVAVILRADLENAAEYFYDESQD